MESSRSALAWVLSKSSEIDLSIQRLGWISEVMPGFTDIRCRISLKGRHYYGWGADLNEDTALLKSLSECFERYVTDEHGLTNSSGVAAHLDQNGACTNAINELIERDSFLCHFITRTPFKRLKVNELRDVDHRHIDEWSKLLGLRLRLFQLGPSGVLCVIDGFDQPKPFGFHIGASVKMNLDSAACSAIIEAARSAIYGLSYPDAKTLAEFESTDPCDFKHHGQLALDLSYASEIAYLFADDLVDESDAGLKYLNPADISTKNLQISLGDCPFAFAVASAPTFQALWVGMPTQKLISIARLRAFSSSELDVRDLNLLPHPFS